MPDPSPYTRLLVPVDYTGCAWDVVGHAARIAQPFGARVTLLYVVSSPPGAHANDPTGASTVGRALDEEASRELEALRGAFGAGVEVHLEVRHGEPVPAICAAIREHAADLVVMGTHARTGIRRLVLGSVAEQVVRRSPVPVLVVRGPGTVEDHPSDAWTQAQAETQG